MSNSGRCDSSRLALDDHFQKWLLSQNTQSVRNFAGFDSLSMRISPLPQMNKSHLIFIQKGVVKFGLNYCSHFLADNSNLDHSVLLNSSFPKLFHFHFPSAHHMTQMTQLLALTGAPYVTMCLYYRYWSISFFTCYFGTNTTSRN